MIKIYSINEIIEASNKFLTGENVISDKLNTDPIPRNIESIILEAENSQLENTKNNLTKVSNKLRENSFEDFRVSKDELVESMHKTFSKKIKKNTLKLILELREEVIFLTKKISSLEKQKEQQHLYIEISKKDIIDLAHIKNEIQNDLKKSQADLIFSKELNKTFNIEHDLLKEKYKNLNVENLLLKKSLSSLRKILIQLKNQTISLKNNNIKINSQLNSYINKELVSKSKIENFEKTNLTNRSFEINNHELKNTIGRYIKKNKELQNEINELKNNSIKVTNNNDNGVNIKELENKIKHYQDENIRISHEFVESNKKFEITKENLNELQKHRGDLIEKINSINEAIKDEKIVTSVFSSNLEDNKIKVMDNNKPTKKDINNLDDKIKDIFAKN